MNCMLTVWQKMSIGLPKIILKRGHTLMKRKIWILSLILVLVLSSLTGCKKNSNSSNGELNSAREIRIGTNSNYFTATVAFKKGFLQKEFGDEYTFTLNNFTNGPAQIEALVADKLDIVQYGDVPTVNGYANKSKATVVSGLWESEDAYGILVKNNSGINSVADLKGKTIAVGIGTNGHQFILQVLKSAGLSENDVKLLNVTSHSDQLSSLIAGNVDAIQPNQPNFDTDAAKADGKIIATNKDYNLAVTLVLARDDFAKQNPEIVSRVLKVFNETNEWIKNNQDEAVKIVADYFGITEEAALKYYTTREWNIGWSDKLTKTLEATIEYEYSQGLITSKPDVSKLYDTSYLEAAGLYNK